MKLNPTAVVFWALGTGVGYLVGSDVRSAVIGLCVALAISLFMSIVDAL